MPLQYAAEKCQLAIGRMMTDPRDLGARVGAAWEDLRNLNPADFPTDELRGWFKTLGNKLGGTAAPLPSAAIATMNDDEIYDLADLIRQLSLRTLKAHWTA
jgi:hypothetical protein